MAHVMGTYTGGAVIISHLGWPWAVIKGCAFIKGEHL